MLLSAVQQVLDVLHERQECTHGDQESRSRGWRTSVLGHGQIRGRARNRSGLPVGEQNHEGALPCESTQGGDEGEGLPAEGMTRIDDGEFRHHSIEEWGVLGWSAPRDRRANALRGVGW